MKYIYAFLFLAFSFSTAFAWSPEQCAVFLQYGIYDENRTIVFDEYFTKMKALYCESNKGSGTLSIGIPQIVDFGGSGDYQKDLCNKEESATSNKYYYSQAQKSINSDIVNALKECVSETKGVTFYIKTSSQPSSFNIVFNYSPHGGIVNDSAHILVRGAKCYSTKVDGEISSGQSKAIPLIPGRFEYSCERRPEDIVTVLVSADISEVLNSNVFLPGYVRPSEPPTSFTFYQPQVKGIPLDNCLNNGHDCGKPSADRWCLMNGFANSLTFESGGAAPLTKTMGDEYECHHPPYICGMISKVTCARRDN
ncbi:hypothetical protein ACCC98_05255 [Rhizobium pisi]|uniref:hypothetical protein n=1 Tax=Rhizobium pisi TaxID=574561 RepID=UPI0039B0142B